MIVARGARHTKTQPRGKSKVRTTSRLYQLLKRRPGLIMIPNLKGGNALWLSFVREKARNIVAHKSRIEQKIAGNRRRQHHARGRLSNAVISGLRNDVLFLSLFIETTGKARLGLGGAHRPAVRLTISSDKHLKCIERVCCGRRFLFCPAWRTGVPRYPISIFVRSCRVDVARICSRICCRNTHPFISPPA